MNLPAAFLVRALPALLLSVWVTASAGQAVLAARVNGVGIALELLDRQFEDLLRERKLQIARMNNPAKAKSIKREALDNLIRIELLWQEAKTAGLVASDEDVDRAVAEVRARFRNHDAFLRRIESSGFSEQDYRVHTRKLLSGERYAQRIVEREVRVTDKDLEDFYALNARLFRRDEHVKVRQILVAVPAHAAQAEKEQARRKIDDLLARARAGESFDALARQHSNDATRQWGGELDPFARGAQAQAFDDAAFALAPGAISDVVETAAGLHIIKLEQRIAAVSIPLAEARERIRDYLDKTRGKEALDKEVEQLRSLADVALLTPL
ncbi:MAG: peptidylprolyl isomerase [Burkholderiaceae bacterium]